MTNSRERHIRQIVDRAEKDKAQQMTVRRSASSVPPSGARSSGRSIVPNRSSESSAKTSKPVEERARASRAGDAASKNVRPNNGAAAPKRPTSNNQTDKPAPKPTSNPAPSKGRKAEESQNARVWIGFVFIFISGVFILSCLSYFKYWRQDADLAQWGEIFSSSSGSAKNWCGKVGAWLGELFIGRWFGIFGLLSGVWTAFLAVKIFDISGLKLRKNLRSTLVVMLLGSVVLGHFAGESTDVFGSGWGGAMGIGVASWLDRTIGNEGTSLLLVLASLSVFYYVNVGWCVRLWKKSRNLLRRYTIWRALQAEAARLRRERLAQENAIQRELNRKRNEEIAAAKVAAMGAINATTTANEVANATTLASVGNATTSETNGADESPFRDDINRGAFENPNQVQSDQGEAVDPTTGEILNEKINELAVNGAVTEEGQQPNITPEPTYVATQNPELDTDIDPSQGYIVAGRSFDETVALDNGQLAAVSGYNEDGSFNFLYLDNEALPSVIQPTVNAELGSEINSEDEFNSMYSVFDKPQVESQVESQIQQIETVSQAQIEQEEHNSTPISLVEQPNISNKVEFKKPTKVIESASGEPALVVEYMQEEDEVDEDTINQVELYDPTLELRNYKKPPINLLRDHKNEVIVTDEELKENQERILYTLGTFGIKIDKIEAVVGPTVTLYEIIPAPGVRISKIKNLEDDIALSLAALGIRIIAPIPGKGTIGIEVPNKDKEVVSMYSVIKSAKFQESKADLPIAIGKTIQNETFVFDLAKMPHLLVAGATGQGKSVGLNAIITSLLYKKHPSELKFILIDPKKVELTLYSKLEKHFLAKVPDADEAIITDTQKVIYTLNSLCIEMDGRYALLKDAGVRSIKEYNDKFTRRRLNPEKGHRYLPYFVVVIDEFADLIMTAGREVETPIARIAQLARAVGIHLIIATQRPTTNIITGVIKANFPARIAFRVTSQIDSRTILDSTGANQLIGRGDMLISTGNEVTRVQCAFVDTPEVEAIAAHVGFQQGYGGAYELPEYIPEGSESGSSRRDDDGKRDPLFAEIARYVVDNQSGSASTVQRKFSIGFNRAGRIIDQLESAGIVGRQEGSKPRQVLIQDIVTLEHIIER